MTTMDVQFTNHGSIWLAQLLTEAAHDWVAANVSDEAQWFGPGLAIEARYVGDIAQGMADDGLQIEEV
jgi:hypothetical protein